MTKAFQSPDFKSKLPITAVSIFSQMSALAEKHQALNLSQGFPNYPASAELIALVDKYMRKGYNQYAPMAGMLALREQIAKKVAKLYDVSIHPETEITITAGGTQALFTTIATLIRPGDEVIVFEPAYDAYRPSVEVFGGNVVPIQLTAPTFAINWDDVRAALTPRTKLLILNNPNNPSAKALSVQDMEALQSILAESNAFVLSDEVYEHLVFDGLAHQSALAYPLLKSRSFVVASFGKLLHTTGWKMGYVIAPAELMKEFQKVHQFNVFSVNTPIQLAIADYLKNEEHYLYLPQFFQEKRDYLLDGLRGSRLQTLTSEGTYFLLVDYSRISDLNELAFAEQLTRENKLASIPVSAFYSKPVEQQLLRLCFAKDQDTLSRAIDLLHTL
ncbi:methionine aminotransferase [Sphingobacterium oryzagri]|uniref:Methionine aminotransferase n=1 Tax=Sphingobacterium oryzagri TaxID=3025669 RepID=A0ABY7WG31_9SPHI|nr:methionine aminotransferase [Sphingobacterium sp. KACC 22765]WDF68599.1 methionine aminotransferase [Sphingobacterium sp. KACC 22765]